jgi:hypothetical protein
LNFLCSLTPDQWAYVHQHAPKGIAEQQPDGYQRSGLYEAKLDSEETLIVIRFGGPRVGYCFWLCNDLFTPLGADRERNEGLEMAVRSEGEADRLRRHAQKILEEASRLEQVASDYFNRALIMHRNGSKAPNGPDSAPPADQHTDQHTVSKMEG